MKAVYGLYRTPHAAQQAFDGLREAGIATNAIAVMSSEPMEEWEFGRHDGETVMPWIAVLGAALGLTTGYFLTSLTQSAWPINTGGMPIVTNWTNLIIMYELTMLGAVFATVITLLKTARLPARLPEFYDPAVSDGQILIGVANPPDSNVGDIEHALHAAGPETVKSVR
jgi:hypothetical protein